MCLPQRSKKSCSGSTSGTRHLLVMKGTKCPLRIWWVYASKGMSFSCFTDEDTLQCMYFLHLHFHLFLFLDYNRPRIKTECTSLLNLHLVTISMKIQKRDHLPLLKHFTGAWTTVFIDSIDIIVHCFQQFLFNPQGGNLHKRNYGPFLSTEWPSTLQLMPHLSHGASSQLHSSRSNLHHKNGPPTSQSLKH